MISYDNKIYYNKNMEPYNDPEWEEAENSNELPTYFYVKCKNKLFIKYYKPSIAKLICKRTGYSIFPLEEQYGSNS